MSLGYQECRRLILVLASVVLGILMMVSMLVVLIVRHPIPPEAVQAARTILSMGAGFAAAGLLGSIRIEGKVAGVLVVAGGGFAVFFLVYVFEPGLISLLGLR